MKKRMNTTSTADINLS